MKKQRVRLFRRENGIYYSFDTLTKKRHSLETTQLDEARRLINTETQMGRANGTAGLWNGATDAFSRVNSETNNTFQYTAFDRQIQNLSARQSNLVS